MTNKTDAVKKGWLTVSQAMNSHPQSIGPEHIVEVMAGDGSTRIGKAGSFSWGWNADEESRIVMYRLLSAYAILTADELLAFIGENNKKISDYEVGLAEAKIQQRTAMNELNRRLQDQCNVNLQQIMNDGATAR